MSEVLSARESEANLSHAREIHSDIFPSGIPLGTVERLGQSDDGLSQKLTVKLAVDYTAVRNVSVITNYHHAEKRTLEFQADSLMSLD